MALQNKNEKNPKNLTVSKNYMIHKEMLEHSAEIGKEQHLTEIDILFDKLATIVNIALS